MSLNQFAIVAGSLLITTTSAFASGSSINRLPAPGVATVASGLDREKFGLGQKIFSGGVELGGHEPTAPQRERLKTLQSRLPEGAAAKINLSDMAGKLLPHQLDALEYFVTQRYPAK
jgi:hypothetical protein